MILEGWEYDEAHNATDVFNMLHLVLTSVCLLSHIRLYLQVFFMFGYRKRQSKMQKLNSRYVSLGYTYTQENALTVR